MNRIFQGRKALPLIVVAMLLASCSGSSDDADSPASDFIQGEIPSTPGSLSGVVYTDTEIEIFWEPATDDGSVVEYQIFRDDVLIDTRDGLSFYQNSLSPDTTYIYSVFAVDDDQQSGPGSSITLTTTPTRAVINAETHVQILEQIVAAANGTIYQDLRAAVEAVYGDGAYGTSSLDTAAETLGLTLVSSEYNPDTSGADTLYDCDGGGTYLFQAWGSAYGGGNGAFQACQSSVLNVDEPLSGTYSRVSTLIKYVFNPGWSFDTTFDDITKTGIDKRTRRLTGQLYDYGAPLSSENWTDLEYTGQAFEGQTTIRNAQVSITSGVEEGGPDAIAWQRTFASGFTLQSPVTGNKPITVVTDTVFSTPYANTCYTTGQFKATAADGSSLTLNADNDDPLSFDLDVTSQDGDFSETLRWSQKTALRLLLKNSADDVVLPVLTTTEHTGDLATPCG